MTPFIPSDKDERRRLWISAWATLGIAMIVGLIYLGVAQRQLDANRRHSDRQNARIVTQLRGVVSQLRHVVNTQAHALVVATYSTNKSVCILRTVAKNQINRLEITKPKGYKQAETFWRNLYNNQIPIPFDLNCAKLPPLPPDVPKEGNS